MRKRIVNRTASDDYDAWCWATVAAGLGWRVVAVFVAPGGMNVWAEAPLDSAHDEWDRAYQAAFPG
jgi:hypothetical protein